MDDSRHDDRERVKRDQKFVKECLDKLDAGSNRNRKDTRTAPRHQYRVRELTVELTNPGGTIRRYAAPTRNISSRGLGFIIGHFVYPGSICRATLVSIQNHELVQVGRVVRCRYLEGTGQLHEVGVKFDVPIEVGMFHRGAAPMRVLIADDDPVIHKLIPTLLKDVHCKFFSALGGKDVIRQARIAPFDLCLIDANMPDMDGLTVARELRNSGYSAPLVCVTANDDASFRTNCLTAGFDLWIAKPFRRDGLESIVTSVREDPVFSALVDEPQMAELIDAFVQDLPTKLRDLHLLIAKSEIGKLAPALHELRTSAGIYGFDVIADICHEIEDSLQEGVEVTVLRPLITRLTRVCRAARGVSCVEIPSPAPAAAART